MSLGILAAQIDAELKGDPDCEISAVATLQNAQAGSISFLSNRAYRKYLAKTQASAVILSKEDRSLCPVHAVVSDNPYLAYARVATLLNPTPAFTGGVHPTAIVHENALVDPSAWIGANSVVGKGTHIGANTFIGPNCMIGDLVSIGNQGRFTGQIAICNDTIIGDGALLHPGVVIGADGFGIANNEGVWVKVPQLGRVRIGHEVEIGANTTIDRGALEDTVIEDGVKLDNQIQIAHNVRIGSHTAIAGCVGIAGSSTIGRHCAIGGGVGILGHLEIADHVHITAMTLVTKSIRVPGVYASGVPHQRNMIWHKNVARLRHLDELAHRLYELEKKIGSD